MNQFSSCFSGLILLGSLACRVYAHSVAEEMAEAASHFLVALSPEQKAKCTFDLTAEERENWHFVPRPRKGLPLKELNPAQRQLAQALLATGLSQRGYMKAATIMSIEEILKDLEQGKGPVRDPELYYVSLFGTPGSQDIWGWRVEGHHLSLNFTVAGGDNVSVTPSFFGSNPAEVRTGPRRGLRVLASEEDLARQLVRSLTPEQLKAALYTNTAPSEIITGADRKAHLLSPAGLSASQMDSGQTERLRSLIKEYVNGYRPELADQDLRKIEEEGLDRVSFAWAGGIEPGQPHYYRLQGPTFLMGTTIPKITPTMFTLSGGIGKTISEKTCSANTTTRITDDDQARAVVGGPVLTLGGRELILDPAQIGKRLETARRGMSSRRNTPRPWEIAAIAWHPRQGPRAHMPDSFRILLVDDNPDDRALAIRELRREFANLKAEEVIDQKGFTRVLESAVFDLVITDFQLRWSDGLAVLRAAKARWPECPVVMFTGTGSEEVAVEAMKAGLDDYVLKSPKHYTRLPSVARLALKVALQRQQLRQADARYGVLFSIVPVGLYRATPDGQLLEANPALVEMLHYPDQPSLLEVNLGDLYLDPADFRTWQSLMQRDGVVHNHEARLRTFQGAVCWVQNRARASRTPSGPRLIYEGSLEAITERKQAEDERERLIAELQDALSKLKTLSGLLPICAGCKRIRDDQGYWNQIELFIQSHSDAEFTHSFCPDCMKKLYPEVFEEATKLRP